jgi:hypothetical protein
MGYLEPVDVAEALAVFHAVDQFSIDYHKIRKIFCAKTNKILILKRYYLYRRDKNILDAQLEETNYYN